ncbi:MAG: hypothetical protein H6524_08790 [Actinobacteria bacterium]|nr:hypothetical protein [Micrococcales bacterium]MCB0903864.1 hypothetical protein [Actinomycetota bacterium]MCO5300802.1 hypothetical protein [Candidatus Nanopelagicales bacterium]MCB9428893.1 hypothetical protein [Actinomycetota bacterium]HPE12461.1 hypothetical protein [Actinomycetota bacterium]
MTYQWRYPDGSSSATFPTQADAETWIGEVWADLLADGVQEATLLEEQRVVYGPMSLRPNS